MPVSIVCPSCQQRLNVRSELQGRTVRCPACKSKFTAPAGSSEGSPQTNDLNDLFPAEPSAVSSSSPSPYEQLASNLLNQAAPPYGHASAPPAASSPAAASGRPSGAAAPARRQPTPARATGNYKGPQSATGNGEALPIHLRIGGFLIFLGFLSVLLPLVGLQIKGLHLLGDVGMYIGAFLGLVGAGVVAIGYLMAQNVVAALMIGVLPGLVLVGLAGGMILWQGSGTGANSDQLAQAADDFNRVGQGSALGVGAPSTSRNSAGQFGPGRANANRAADPTADFGSRIPGRSSTANSAVGRNPSGKGDAKPGLQNARIAADPSPPRERSQGELAEQTARIDQGVAELEKLVNGQANFAAEGEKRLQAGQDLHQILNRQMKMETDLGPKLANNFPPQYLTKVVGEPDARETVLVHPQRKPILGFDFAASPNRTDELAAMIPVYIESEGSKVLAKEGYAVGGLNLHVAPKIVGFQVIFMKLAGKGFEPSDRYLSPWYGREPSDGTGITLGGDGRPVYGICTFGFSELAGLQLILEPKK